MKTEVEIREMINTGENIFVDFKSSEYFEARPDHIAADIISFANRYGGNTLIGILNNGHIEGCSFDNNAINKYQLKFSHIANSSCSPNVNLYSYKVAFEEGDVIVIDIKKR